MPKVRVIRTGITETTEAPRYKKIVSCGMGVDVLL